MTDRRRRRRHDSDVFDNSDEDEDDERLLYYLPGDGINIEVLIFYIKLFLGHDSDAEPGNHPIHGDKDGYFIRSRFGLTPVRINYQYLLREYVLTQYLAHDQGSQK